MAVAAPHPTAIPAGCGGVVSTRPAHWHHSYLPALAIGDSTMLLALPYLAEDGFSANAHGCRQYPEALELLEALRHAHELPRVVVIALGANGEITEGDVRTALQILGHNRLLVLVTPRQLGGSSGSNASLVRAETRRYPKRVRVLDWVAYSAEHPEWFQPDGLHLTISGSRALATLIDRAQPLAAPPRSVPVPNCTLPPASVPATPGAVTWIAPDGVLDERSSRLRVPLANMSSSAIGGIAELREATPRGPIIAASCVSVAAGARALVTLKIDREALAELELRFHYAVRLELLVTEPTGQRALIDSEYLLQSHP